jgi:hypothetical protein
MSSWVYPRLIGPKDLKLLFLCPKEVLPCPFESVSLMLFSKRWFPSCLTADKSLLFECGSDGLLSTVPAQDSRNISPVQVTVNDEPDVTAFRKSRGLLSKDYNYIYEYSKRYCFPAHFSLSHY